MVIESTVLRGVVVSEQITLFKEMKKKKIKEPDTREVFEMDGVICPGEEDLQRDKKYNGMVHADDYFRLIDTPEEMRIFMEGALNARAIAVDTETEGLGKHRHRIIGYCLSYRVDGASLDLKRPLEWDKNLLCNAYLPVRHRTNDKNLDPVEVASWFSRLTADDTRAWFMWNAKYDMHMLENEGIPLPKRIIDGMIFRRLCDPNGRAALKAVADEIEPGSSYSQDLIKVFLKQLCRLNKWKLSSKSSTAPSRYEYVPTPLMGAYGARDTYYTWLATERHMAQVVSLSRNVEDAKISLSGVAKEELSIVSPLYDMERFGLYADKARLLNVRRKIESTMQDIEEKIRAGFLGEDEELPSLSSNQQVVKFLQENNVKLTRATKSTRDLPESQQTKSVDSDTLLRLARDGYELADLISRWRDGNSILSKYVDSFPDIIEKTGAIHGSFNQAGTATGRMSSSGPNLQNMPSRGSLASLVKDVFVIPPQYRDSHVWVFADLSQIEIRLLAHLSQDQALVRGYKEGIDVHASTAQDMFKVQWDNANAKERKRLRSIGKQVNFLIVYGGGPGVLASVLFKGGVVATPAQCKTYLELYMKARPGVAKWIAKTKREAKRNGKLVNEYGRMRFCRELQDVHTPIRQKKGIERSLTNFVVQGTAADLFKAGLSDFYWSAKKKKIDIQMINNIHDEVQYLVPRHHLRASMEQASHSFEVVSPRKIECSVPIVMDFEYSMYGWGSKKDLTEELVSKIENREI